MVIEQGKEVAHKSIKYITYKDLQKVVGQVASAATELGIAPEVEDVPGLKMKFLGVYSKNRAEWMYVDLACIMYGFVLVPM
jgi:long-subunit acyl-CoA synthetase (AMP-forming)